MFLKECVMIRIASMIIPVAATVALLTGAAQAGDYYERTGAGRYKPTDGAWYSSACCYKKIIKHITITKAVWVKVPPPKPQHVEADDDDAVEAPRQAPQGHPHRPQVVELGEDV